MRLEGMIRTEHRIRLEEIEAPAYQDAKNALEAKVSEGELLLSIRRIDD